MCLTMLLCAVKINGDIRTSYMYASQFVIVSTTHNHCQPLFVHKRCFTTLYSYIYIYTDIHTYTYIHTANTQKFKATLKTMPKWKDIQTRYLYIESFDMCHRPSPRIIIINLYIFLFFSYAIRHTFWSWILSCGIICRFVCLQIVCIIFCFHLT